MNDWGEIIGAVAGVVMLVVLVVFLLAFPTMWLWNFLFEPHVTTYLFGVPELTFGRALALNFLTGILFQKSSSSKSK